MTRSGEPRWEDPDTLEWPTGRHNGSAVAVFDARVEVRKKRVDAEIQRTAARYNADLLDLGRFSTAYTTLVTGSVERARAGADAVTKASAALVALYTGVLGLTFSVTDNPLPVRGVLSPIFLGAAVVLATAYLAFLRTPDERVDAPEAAASRPVEHNVIDRCETLAGVAKVIVSRRAWCLRAAVVSLGFGLAYMPLPFIAPIGGDGTSPKSEWPSVVLTSGENVELAKLRYAEQLKEIVLERQSGSTDLTMELTLVAILLAVGILGVVISTYASRARGRR